MSYRKGFQRLYVVTVLAWSVASGAVMIHGLHFYPYPDSPAKDPWTAKLTPVAEHPGVFTSDEDFCDEVKKVFPLWNEKGPELAETCDKIHERDEHRRNLQHVKEFAEVLAIVLMLPILVYGLLFHVGRWVYQGFTRSEAQA
jgi:hypothetical protein